MGIGSLALRTDTLFTPAPLKKGPEFLSIYLSSTPLTFYLNYVLVSPVWRLLVKRTFKEAPLEPGLGEDHGSWKVLEGTWLCTEPEQKKRSSEGEEARARSLNHCTRRVKLLSSSLSAFSCCPHRRCGCACCSTRSNSLQDANCEDEENTKLKRLSV